MKTHHRIITQSIYQTITINEMMGLQIQSVCIRNISNLMIVDHLHFNYFLNGSQRHIITNNYSYKLFTYINIYFMFIQTVITEFCI